MQVRAVASGDLGVSAVYVLVRGREHATVKDTDFEDGRVEKEIIRAKKQTYDARFELAGAQQLSAGQEYHWEGSFSLPATVNPTFRGQMIQHIWQLQGGLDVFGNDPDSGWQEIEVTA